MVKDASEIPRAQNLIDGFVSEHGTLLPLSSSLVYISNIVFIFSSSFLGLVVTGVRGKVLEYLSRFKKDHYEALVNAGLIGKKIS